MVPDHGRGQKLVVEEALYAHSDDTCFNQKWGLKFLGCLMTGDNKGRALPLTFNVY